MKPSSRALTGVKGDVKRDVVDSIRYATRSQALQQRNSATGLDHFSRLHQQLLDLGLPLVFRSLDRDLKLHGLEDRNGLVRSYFLALLDLDLPHVRIDGSFYARDSRIWNQGQPTALEWCRTYR